MSAGKLEPPAPATTPGSPNGPPPGSVGPLARLALVAVLAGACAAGALAITLFATGALHSGKTVTTTVVTQQPAARSATAGLPASTLYARSAPGVVAVRARVVTEAVTPFGPRQEEGVQTGAGSVLDRQGHILTAEHVVEGATSVTVSFWDGSVRSATVVGRDPSIDIALLKFDPSGSTLHPLPLGSSKSLRVGDSVFAIGDPFGYVRSMSGGLVSGLDRTIEAPNGFTVAHAIQTDAALNPGNSGGPLLDAQARVIGVADQIATGSSSDTTNAGVGFAVPIGVVKSVLPQLKRGVTPTHAYLGVAATDATSSGALVQTVEANSPAAGAGLAAGDVIVAVDAAKVTGAGDLVAAVAAHRPGDSVTLTVERGPETLSLDVTLASQPRRATGG